MPSGLVGLDIMTVEVHQLHLDAVGAGATLDPILGHVDLALQLRRPLVQPDDVRYTEASRVRTRALRVIRCDGVRRAQLNEPQLTLSASAASLDLRLGPVHLAAALDALYGNILAEAPEFVLARGWMDSLWLAGSRLPTAPFLHSHFWSEEARANRLCLR
jgi:hypothetical protein